MDPQERLTLFRNCGEISHISPQGKLSKGYPFPFCTVDSGSAMVSGASFCRGNS